MKKARCTSVVFHIEEKDSLVLLLYSVYSISCFHVSMFLFPGVLVPELVHRLLDFGVLLSSEQFDLVVKIMNSALVDQTSAMILLPITTIIYRVCVHVHTCSSTYNRPLFSITNYDVHVIGVIE